MDRAFDLAVGTFGTGLGGGIVGAVDFFNESSFFVLLETGAVDNVGTFETRLLIGRHTEELLIGFFFEVGTLDPQFTAELNGVRSFLGTFGVVHHFEFFNLPFGIVGDDKFHGIEDSRNAGGTFVEVGTHGALEQFHIVECIEGGVTDLIDELADAFRAVTATTNATNGRHAGIVPTIDHAFFRQNQEISL